MDIFQGTKHLVQKELVMLLGQIIVRLNNLVQIGIHEFKDNIDILEILLARWKHDVLYLNYIRMPQHPKQFNFSQNSCSIRGVFENVFNFLYGNLFSSLRVGCRANNTIAAFPNNLLNLVPVRISIT